MNDIIYLDNNATTPVDPRVFEAMIPYFTNSYANAASNHKFGHDANNDVKSARNEVAHLINAQPHEIVFTSGATESINLAIKGLYEQYGNIKNHIITVKTEHKAVLDVCSYLEEKGAEVTYLSVDKFGLIDLTELESSITDKTLLVAVMYVNNETGVIQEIEEIAELVHEKGAFLLSDATQAFGKIPINVKSSNIDLLAFSAHKVYGPKGVGGLYVNASLPNRVKLVPLIHGGGHERKMRSGTLNVPGIVGLGKAAEIAHKEMDKNSTKIKVLRDNLEKELLKIEGASLNGHPTKRLYNVTNIHFKGIDADALMMNMENFYFSNGSACTSANIEPSHVLSAMGLTEDEAYSSIRLSLGGKNTSEETIKVIKSMKESILNLKRMNLSV